MNNTNNSENNGISQNAADDKDIIIVVKQLTDRDKVKLVEYLNNKNSVVIYYSESKYKNEIQELLIQHNQLDNHHIFDFGFIEGHLNSKNDSLNSFKEMLANNCKYFDNGVLCHLILLDGLSFKELPLYKATSSSSKEDHDYDEEEEFYIVDDFSLIKLKQIGAAQPRLAPYVDIKHIQTHIVGFKLKR